MKDEIKVAMIGLDSSHANEFTKRFQDPECEEEQKVGGVRVVNCLSFYTRFMKDEERKERQEGLLKGMGVEVTEDFDEAVAGCDAIMIEINDPSFHREYLARCVELGKPIFLDKPLADTLANGKDICRLAQEKGVRMFSSSSLRFVAELERACEAIEEPRFASVYGPLGKAPAGSGVVWYGVHTFEMLERAMGRGAETVTAYKDGAGVVAVVKYPDERRGIVELGNDAWVYGGCLRTNEKDAAFTVDFTNCYSDMLRLVVKFFAGGEAPLEMADTMEVMALLEATERACDSGKTVAVGAV